jgi:nucleotide-binding universal stress UspA family protein
MPGVHEGCGRSATALARAAGCPVLVARQPTSRSTLLVATDLGDDLAAIFRRAAALAGALHAPVLAFHDAAFPTPGLSSRVNTLTDVWAQIQTERMHVMGHQRLPELEVLLAHGTDRVSAILQQARREDAEILVVGLSEQAASGSDELAASVVDRAIRSVLVVPSSNIASETQPRHSPADEAREPHAAMTGLALERRRWPRSGVRARLSRIGAAGIRAEAAVARRSWWARSCPSVGLPVRTRAAPAPLARWPAPRHAAACETRWAAACRDPSTPAA